MARTILRSDAYHRCHLAKMACQNHIVLVGSPLEPASFKRILHSNSLGTLMDHMVSMTKFVQREGRTNVGLSYLAFPTI